MCPVGGLPTRQLIIATRPLWSQVRELFQDPRRFAAELSDSTSTLYVQRGWLPEGGKDNDFDVVQLQLTTRARAGVENCTKTGSQRRTTDSTISWGGLFRPPLVNSKEVFAVGRGSTGETAQKKPQLHVFWGVRGVSEVYWIGRLMYWTRGKGLQ